MKARKKRDNTKRQVAKTEIVARVNRRRRRRVLKTVTGAIIGGVIAGPVGVAAGAIAGASVRRGPARRKGAPVGKAKTPLKAKASKQRRAVKRRFVNIYPNIP
mgnify:CR=1 FL=1